MNTWYEGLQQLWMDYLFWIRYYALSLMFQLRDFNYVASRTLRNASDFADALTSFYGEEFAKQFGDLMTRHILLFSELAATIRAGQNVDQQREAWYENAVEIAGLLAEVNPDWDRATWLQLFEHRYYLEENLLLKLYQGDFLAAINQFDEAHLNVLQIASYMTEGIERQFQPLAPQKSPPLTSPPPAFG